VSGEGGKKGKGMREEGREGRRDGGRQVEGMEIFDDMG